MAKPKTVKKMQPAGEHTDVQPASSLMALVKTDPLGALTLTGAELQRLDERYERRRSKLLGVGYAVACRLYREWPEWTKFVRAELWKRRTKKPKLYKDRNRVLLPAFRYMLGARDQEADKKARFYATALEPYFNRSVKPEDISGKICEDGGIRALYDIALAERRKARQHARIMADDYFEDGAKRPKGLT